VVEIFPIPSEPPASAEPCECSFDNPAPRQDFEAFYLIGAPDYFCRQVWQRFLLTALEFLSLIACIGEQLFQKWMQTEQRREHEHATITILNIGRMHDGMHQQALRIDENVPLLAFDFLARIISRWID
jgi:hypothetical protein